MAKCLVRERSGRWLLHLAVPVLGGASLVVILSSTSWLTRVVGLGWLAVGMAGHLLRGRQVPVV